MSTIADVLEAGGRFRCGPDSRRGDPTTHGMTRTPEYRSWCGMIERCERVRHRKFKNYGGRGIVVCRRWRESFAAFFADMGPKPSPRHSLDRVYVNGNYEPGNCRWATDKQQARNKTSSRVIRIAGLDLTVAEWAERLGIGAGTIHRRLGMGWSDVDALTRPIVWRGIRK